MDLTVTERRENGLLDRTEVYFTLAHPQAGTPTRAEIRKALAGTIDAKGGVIVLDWARSEFGRSSTRGYAKVYKSKERALALETPPILIRNGLMAAVKKAEAPKEERAAPAPRAEEKPAKEAPKAEAPKKEPTPKAPPKEEAAKKEAPKKEAPKPPAKEEKKEERKEPAKKAEAPKEKKAPAKKEGK